MKLGVFTVLYQNLPFEVMLDKLADMGVEAVELGTRIGYREVSRQSTL
ncbi:sugar phosphate isomerase/epimerase [Neobacillus niacini]|nr:sugar phosphate isomerase/epimerase [Neobacillus niacini]